MSDSTDPTSSAAPPGTAPNPPQPTRGVEVTVNLTDDAFAALEEISQVHGVNLTDALHIAIAKARTSLPMKRGNVAQSASARMHKGQ